MSDVMIGPLARGMRIPSIGSWGDYSFYGTCPSKRSCPYLWVNYATTMPSELSESGFHTNPVQNQLNMSDSWKRLEAYTFYWSILQFHDITRPPVSILTGIIYDVESGIPINGAVAGGGGLTDTTDTYESLFHKFTTDPGLLHNGFYFLEDMPGDTVELVFSAPGYYPDTMQVAMVDSFFTFRDAWLVSSITRIAYNATGLPTEFALRSIHPNPFNPTTTIAYDVPRTAYVRLTVYNLLGRPVRTLVRGMVDPGYCQVVWDGKDRHGRPVASGIYIVRLEVEGFAQSRKLVLAR